MEKGLILFTNVWRERHERGTSASLRYLHGQQGERLRSPATRLYLSLAYTGGRFSNSRTACWKV